MFVCLFLALYPINVKTAEPIRPKFCVGPHAAPGKVYGQSDFKYVILEYFVNFENARKNIISNPQIKKNVLYGTKRKCSQIKPQLKVEKEDGREA